MSALSDFITNTFGKAAQLYTATSNVYASFALASNQANGIVSYAEGVLLYSPKGSEAVPIPLSRPPSFNVQQAAAYYFSDRRVPATGNALVGSPFNPNQTDKLGLSLVLALSGESLSVILTLESWGNVQVQLDLLDAQPGVLLGTGSPVGSGATLAVYTLSIFNVYNVPLK